MFCEITELCWLDDNGHVRGHLNSCILNYIQYCLGQHIFGWILKFRDYSTHKIHEIKCLTNNNYFTLLVYYMQVKCLQNLISFLLLWIKHMI